MNEYRFLTIEDVIDIHDKEINTAGGLMGIRDLPGLESAVYAPQATFQGEYLMSFFEMVATYIVSISMNHPFLDGNKRAAAASALTFMFLNGFILTEHYEEELADTIIKFLTKEINKEKLIEYFQNRSISV